MMRVCNNCPQLSITEKEVKFVSEKACFAAVDIGGGNVTFISDYINCKYEIEVIGNTFTTIPE